MNNVYADTIYYAILKHHIDPQYIAQELEQWDYKRYDWNTMEALYNIVCEYL